MLELNKNNDGMLSLVGQLNNVEEELRTVRQSFDNILLGQQGDIHLDVSKLETVNSLILSLLLCFMRSAAKNGISLKVENISKSLFDMARVGGLEELLSAS